MMHSRFLKVIYAEENDVRKLRAIIIHTTIFQIIGRNDRFGRNVFERIVLKPKKNMVCKTLCRISFNSI